MRYLLRLSFCLLLLLCATFSTAQTKREPLKLLRVTPAGEDIPLSAQIVFEFNRPVVPLGRMERLPEEVPIAIMPRLACAWRWLNTTTLACELGERTTMARATRYTVIVQPGIQTEDGATLVVPFTHTFLTQRPKVTAVIHQTWAAPGAPVLLVLFDQPVTASSVTSHVYVQAPTKKRLTVSASESPKHKGRGWLIRPVEELPQDTSVTVWVEPGIVSTQGREPGAEQRAVYAFDTFPPLRVVGLSCTVSPQQIITIPAVTKQPPPLQCDPQHIALLFSAPVHKDGAQEALRLTPALTSEGADANPWEDAPAPSTLTLTHRRGNRYPLPFPFQV
jgi:alpha-2-macroglobulin